MSPADLEPIFAKVEAAINAHPKLRRVGSLASKTLGQPEVTVSRLGCDVHIQVKLQGSRKRPSKINGTGETVEEAADKLISLLDLWAEAIK
jgi:hypothetical protein